MSRFTDQHEKGIRAFTESLEQKVQACGNCGFEAPVLHAKWITHVETDPRTGHIRYRLTCPDCRSTEIVDIDI